MNSPEQLFRAYIQPSFERLPKLTNWRVGYLLGLGILIPVAGFTLMATYGRRFLLAAWAHAFGRTREATAVVLERTKRKSSWDFRAEWTDGELTRQGTFNSSSPLGEVGDRVRVQVVPGTDALTASDWGVSALTSTVSLVIFLGLLALLVNSVAGVIARLRYRRTLPNRYWPIRLGVKVPTRYTTRQFGRGRTPALMDRAYDTFPTFFLDAAEPDELPTPDAEHLVDQDKPPVPVERRAESTALIADRPDGLKPADYEDLCAFIVGRSLLRRHPRGFTYFYSPSRDEWWSGRTGMVPQGLAPRFLEP